MGKNNSSQELGCNDYDANTKFVRWMGLRLTITGFLRPLKSARPDDFHDHPGTFF